MILENLQELTADQKRFLHETTIEEEVPGAILLDFATLLDFIREVDVPLTGTHLLPLKLLAPLNERMTNPHVQTLQRPTLKSYPHLEGLFLLSRASGLTYVNSTRKKPRLILDSVVYNSWATLNPTERYFTLLESWILRGHPEILGENGNLFDFFGPLSGWKGFFEKVPKQGKRIVPNTEDEHSLRYFPGLRNLALMELFGFAIVQRAPLAERKSWPIASIERTPLGDATLQLLLQHLADILETRAVLDPPSLVPPGQLQSKFQPYFPQWHNNLVIPGHDFEDGVYLFQVSLSEHLWRKIAIPATKMLEDLSRAILDAYEFNHDHLHEFIFQSRFGINERVRHPYMEEEPFTTEVRVGDLPLSSGASMTYLYDLGASWLFDVRLERIDPIDSNMSEPTLVEKSGDAPEQYPF